MSDLSRHRLADVREHTTTLPTLDPDAPLDDLEPLRDIVGDARVFAVGEGCHFVEEFGTTRQRLFRFLAERCGFTVLAFEFGFAEGEFLDRWVHGRGDSTGLAGIGGTTNSGMNGRMARWLRRHNQGEHPLRFLGVDMPDAGGTLRPVLDPVREYLREVDPEALPRVDTACEIADRIAGRSFAISAPRWAELHAADQDRLTALLARLLVRLRALEPLSVSRSDQASFDLAERHLETACQTDYMIGAMQEVFTDGGRTADASVRDFSMAETVRWYLDRADSDTRVILAAHNSHIQKTPVRYDGHLAALPLGYYLAREFGAAYRGLALTHTAGSVPEMYPDGSPDSGFAVTDTAVDSPSPGSVEAGLLDAGLGDEITLTDLRHAPDGDRSLPDRIRGQSDELVMPVRDSFDGVLSVPTVTAEVTTALG